MGLSQQVLDYIDAHKEEAYQLLLELARIPAPSNHEERRAAFCRDWLEKQGARGVYVDDALNVVYPIGLTEENPIAVFIAHSDVVFPDMELLPLREENGRIYCPGIGDDTADVIALLMAAKFIAQKQLLPRKWGLLLVVNSGEEGLGNLKGARKIMERYGSRIREFVTFDDHDCFGVNRAVGSKRYRIAIDTEGGHSFADFGNRNAIACLASLIETLYRVKLPPKGKTTYNVGTISGGTSVNTIAQHAEMLYEFRSDERESLSAMEAHLNAAVEKFRNEGIRVTVTLVGERPCAAPVDTARQEQLMQRASEASMRHYGRAITFTSGSTDCNIPLSMGVPAICVGCYCGGGSHTREEYVETGSLLPGLKLAFDLILHYF